MKFSIYSEVQNFPGKSPARQYREVIEQVVHADRVGFDAYSAIEHFFFPRFSISPTPRALVGVRPADRAHHLPDARPRAAVPQPHDPRVPDRPVLPDVPGPLPVRGLRGHGWIPAKAGVPVIESRERYEESLDILFKALEEERFSYDGSSTRSTTRTSCRGRRAASGSSPAARATGRTNSRPSGAGRSWCPPLLPYAALKDQFDLYRTKCAEHGTIPDIVWIHACYLDDDRETARREAEEGMKNFLAGNASPLTGDDRLPPAEEMNAAGYGFYLAGILEQLAATPYDEMIDGDIVWVGTPDDVIERIEAVRDVCEGLTEVSITVNPGGLAHWQAIKAQELFADRVMPHFRPASVQAAEPSLA